jgi:hypothetical protein
VASAAGEAAGVAGRASLRLAGGTWHVASPHGTGTVPDMTGLAQLARVLATPGVAHPAVELAALAAPALAAGTVPVAADLGPALDGRAKREYRRRIVELRAELDEADDHHDLARASKLRAELDALLAELRRAVGLGGRDRPQGSGNERARINTTRNVRRAIAAIGRAVPGLGAHLDASVRTGHACTYAPEPSTLLTWTVTRGDDPGP